MFSNSICNIIYLILRVNLAAIINLTHLKLSLFGFRISNQKAIIVHVVDNE